MSGRLRRPTGDDGAISVLVAAALSVLLLAAGFVVDGGGKLRALRQVDLAATEAARAGGQAITAGTGVEGAPPEVDRAAAIRAARAYLREVGVTGTVEVRGDQLHVNTSTVYTPTFLSAFGMKPVTVTGNSTARLIRGIDTPEEEAP